MIDISVSGLVKEFEVGTRILDGLTFQIDQGERVGLLGRNGAGKTTFLKILTGELDYDEGEVMVAPGKTMGLISQIPVYPPEYTVDDVLRTAFERLRRMEQEMTELTERMARESDPAILRRYDQLSAAFEAGGGYDTETELNKVCNGLLISQDMRRQDFASLSRGRKDPGEPGPAHSGKHGYPPAGRAHQPSGPAGHRVAGGVSGPLQGHCAGHLP